MAQAAPLAPNLTDKNFKLEVVHYFTYLGSAAADNLSLNVELDKRFGQAATERVWENRKLTVNTKMAVYRACIVSTLLYGSDIWTSYTNQERKLHTFHRRCLRRILRITWKDKVTNNY